MPAARQTEWTLAALLDGYAAAPAAVITGMTLDSRDVSPGDLFVARQGHAAHGIDWAEAAIGRGASAILCDLAPDDPRLGPIGARVPVVCLPSLDGALGDIAARFFGNPARRMRLEAVTGTNGKSSVAWLAASARDRLGRDAALVGTLGAGRPAALHGQSLTTPDVIGLHRTLAQLAGEGVRNVTLEASSHAIAQHRLDGAQIAAAAFTNLSRDHLDYHGTMDAYFEAKAALFAVRGLQTRVICTDDEYGRRLYERHAPDAVAVSTTGAPSRAGRYVFAAGVDAGDDGWRIAVESHAGAGMLTSPLLGRFNVANLVIALALLLESGERFEAAVTALASVRAPRGRMQRVGSARPAVVVDYAHTPAAIESALAALRPVCAGRLWIVFGCGGDRDRGKRPLMAAAAEAGADCLVLTSDNPRGEDPAAIIGDMRAGLSADRAGQTVTSLPDRRHAIEHAIESAHENDWILIAGKGHETTQTIAGVARPFDDAAVAEAALARRSGTVTR